MDRNVLHRFFAGTASFEEEEAVCDWVDASDKNREELIRERKYFDVLLLHKTKNSSMVQSGHRFSLPFVIRESLKIAAAISVLIVSALYIYNNVAKPAPVLAMNKLVVPPGQRANLTLSDGTNVWLNACSEMTYPASFSEDTRRVSLKGEAYFDVSKDVEHPFIVVTDDVQVRVYGTSFNVNTLGADGVRTVLVEGKVGIRGQDLDREYVLKPNELAFYDRNSRDMKIETVDPDLYTLWRKGIFVFERETLENIMNTLSLWYDMEVFFQSESAKQLHFSGHMKRYEQIEDILHAITDATGVVFTINDRTVCVSR